MNEKPEPRELAVIECDRQMSVARFSPCGKYLFAGGYDASVRRWDMTGEQPESLDHLNGHHGWVQGLAFQPGGELLFSVDSWRGLRATRYADEPQVEWSNDQAHDGWIRALAPSADGKLVATAGRDRRARPRGATARRVFGLQRTASCCMSFPNIRTKFMPWQCIPTTRRWSPVICWERFGVGISLPESASSLEVRHTARFGPEKQGFVFDLTGHPHGYWAAVSSGQPGNGQFLLIRPGEDEPFFITTKMFNCHSIDVHPDGRLAVASTNRRSQGNGAVTDQEGNYLGNYSPIPLFDPPPVDSSKKAG